MSERRRRGGREGGGRDEAAFSAPSGRAAGARRDTELGGRRRGRAGSGSREVAERSGAARSGAGRAPPGSAALAEGGWHRDPPPSPSPAAAPREASGRRRQSDRGALIRRSAADAPRGNCRPRGAAAGMRARVGQTGAKAVQIKQGLPVVTFYLKRLNKYKWTKMIIPGRKAHLRMASTYTMRKRGFVTVKESESRRKPPWIY